jgi:hypothetical protein
VRSILQIDLQKTAEIVCLLSQFTVATEQRLKPARNHALSLPNLAGAGWVLAPFTSADGTLIE